MSAELRETAIDIAANRAGSKYSVSEQLRRVAWSLGRWLIRLSPRPAFAWRRAVLRLFGAKVGHQAHVYPTSDFYMPWNVELGDWSAVGEHAFIYSLGKVRIGRNATLSYRSHVCAGTHDLNDPTLPLLKPTVRVGDGAWVGTEAFIGPGVTIGENAVLGARAVAMRDVAALAVVVGNPARVIGQRKLP